MILLGIALLGAGVLLLRLWIREFNKGRASDNWQRTQGVILTSNIESSYRTSVHDSEMDSERFRFMNNRIQGPKVTYRYRIAGKEHTNHRIQFCLMYSASLKKNQRLISRFPQGSDIDIYYDPADPSESVLIRGANGLGFVAITFLGAAMVMLGMMIVFK